MLILTRKDGQTITLTCADGTKIVIQTVCAETGRVRLGIDAPPSVSILRDDAVIKEKTTC